jgi:hypothetical protein
MIVIKMVVMTKRDDQVLQLGKEEREKQKPSVDQGKGIK